MRANTVGLFFSIFFVVSAASAAEYYVAPNGSDSGDGSLSQPYKTFDPAIRRAAPGDTIYAREGTYGTDHAVPFVHDFGSGLTFLNVNGRNGVANGTAEAPIVIENYPGEHAVLDARDVSTTAVYLFEKSYWTVRGFEMIGGGVLIQGSAGDLVHDITIEENHIHDVDAGNDGDNTGMIVVNRGDTSGPSRIFIRNNTIHGNTRHGLDWESMSDPQHTAALTVLSECGYDGNLANCTGSIEFSGNTVYEVPQLFFFKNTMVGPVEITGNVFHDARTIGIFHTADAHLSNNLFYDVPNGMDLGGDSDFASDEVRSVDGKNAVIENNTFVGLENGLALFVGSGHRVERNVFFGFSGRTSGAGWDTGSYLVKSNHYPDPSDPGASLIQGMDSDYNCFITPSGDFLMVKRLIPGGGESDYYDREGARETFGLDANSVFLTETDPKKVFVDPDGLNYELLEGSACGDLGAGASEPVGSAVDSPTADDGGCGVRGLNSEAGQGVCLLMVVLFLANSRSRRRKRY